MKKEILYVGLDVHKNTIDVAVATSRSNGTVRSHGKIDSTLDALNKLINKMKGRGVELRFVYEAGPCGYQIYRHLVSKNNRRKINQDQYKDQSQHNKELIGWRKIQLKR